VGWRQLRKSIAGRSLSVGQKVAIGKAFKRCGCGLIAIRVGTKDAECVRYTKDIAKTILDNHDSIEVQEADQINMSTDISIYTNPGCKMLADDLAVILGATEIVEENYGRYHMIICIRAKPIA